MPSKYGFGNTRKKSPAYKMKGFSGFGNSPAKVSDKDILDLQSKLDTQELGFKKPGWTKAAGHLFNSKEVVEKEDTTEEDTTEEDTTEEDTTEEEELSVEEKVALNALE